MKTRKNQERNKKILKRFIKKRIETTMIGALAAFEEVFGDIWGYDKDYEDLTTKEKNFDENWEYVRTRILDLGNLQLKQALDELDRYNLELEPYHLDFVIKKGKRK